MLWIRPCPPNHNIVRYLYRSRACQNIEFWQLRSFGLFCMWARARDVTIGNFSSILKGRTKVLRKNTTPWKRNIYKALLAAKQKLRDYYEKTYRDHRYLYRTGALLAPQYKLYGFDDTEYSKCHIETSKRYYKYLRTSLLQYQQQIPKISFRTTQPSFPQHTSELDRLLFPSSRSELSRDNNLNEVDRYLREGESY
jgi:hypothetical protein